MQFIKDLKIIIEKDDLSKLPEDIVKKLKKLIRDGAADLKLDWSNAMELVKKAYEVEGVTMPSPEERSAWDQYEELLQIGVKELAEARSDFDNSWRMSSTVFREFKESMKKEIQVRVYEIGDSFAKGHTVKAENMQEVIDMIRKQAGRKAFDMEVDEQDDDCCTCRFSYQGIKRPYHIKLQRL